MAFSIVPTVSDGDSWSAANHNTYIRDNFAWAKGEIDTLTAAVATPIIIAARQGGSATDWSTSGTDNYAPGKSIMQAGVAFGETVSGETYFEIDVTFPVAFSAKPIVVATFDNTTTYLGAKHPLLRVYVASGSTFKILVSAMDAQSPGGNDVKVHWIAVGPIA